MIFDDSDWNMYLENCILKYELYHLIKGLEDTQDIKPNFQKRIIVRKDDESRTQTIEKDAHLLWRYTIEGTTVSRKEDSEADRAALLHLKKPKAFLDEEALLMQSDR